MSARNGSEAVVAAVLEDARNGVGYKEIAAKHGKTVVWVSTIARSHGVYRHGVYRNSPTVTRGIRKNEELRHTVVAMLKEGRLMKDIGKAVGVSRQRVQQIADENGIHRKASHRGVLREAFAPTMTVEEAERKIVEARRIIKEAREAKRAAARQAKKDNRATDEWAAFVASLPPKWRSAFLQAWGVPAFRAIWGIEVQGIQSPAALARAVGVQYTTAKAHLLRLGKTPKLEPKS